MTRKIAAIAAAGAVLAMSALVPANAQDAPACELDRAIVFADLGYDSAQFHNAVARFILQAGYGCETDAIPGETIPLNNGVARGDVDVIMEVWMGNPTQAWVDAEAAGDVVQVGSNFPDATEGWFVPRYLVDGPDAIAPGLRSVADLPNYIELFTDPEEPGKGRFYNCPAGWVCEGVNSKKLIAYGLGDFYVNFRVSGQALVAAAESAVLQGLPVLFYYWSPTWLMGKYDFYRLEEAPFDQAIWDAMMAADDPIAATAYPVSNVIIGANAEFAAAAPNVIEFLEAYETTSLMVSQSLAYMQDNDATADEAAEEFLRVNVDVWTAWVSADVAARVNAALAE
ncbi:MAG: ABC transporter substrate-binding protein [Alphaproteobacteria bacterium]